MFLAKTFQKDIRVRQEAKTLSEAGYPVYVLSWNQEAKFPTTARINGCTVRSFRYVKFEKLSKFELAFSAILFQIWLMFETVKLTSLLKMRPIIHAHDFNTLVPGYILRTMGLSRGLVYDAHELSYAAYNEFFGFKLGSIVRAIEEPIVRHTDVIITVSPGFANYYRKFNAKTAVICNCPRISDIPKASKRELRRRLGLPPYVFIVSYVGTVRYDSRFELLLSVAHVLKGDERVLFLIVGGDEKMRPLSSNLIQPTRVAGARLTYIPFTSREEALAYVAASDLTWAIYDKRSLNMRLTLPWKLFESMACHVPVIVDKGTAKAALVEEVRCGLVTETDDPTRISRLIISLVNKPAKLRDRIFADRRFAQQFTWESMSVRLIETYRSLRQSS